MNKNPTPKSEFIKSKPFVEGHNRLIESPEFQRAIETSKAQYLRALHGVAPSVLGDNPNPAAANISALLFQRIQGVEDFCAILFNLAEPVPEMPKPSDPDNLIRIPRK
jgi:hypothetical protein